MLPFDCWNRLAHIDFCANDRYKPVELAIGRGQANL